MGAVIAIDYGAMSDTAKAARSSARECRDYADNIDKKVSRKVSSLTMGSNGNTGQADYFARQKINELNQKKAKYEEFARKVDEANTYAKDTDRNVSSYIKRASNDFRDSHDMHVGVIEEFFMWATTTLLNQTAFGRFLNSLTRGAAAWLDTMKRGFRDWYKLEGGKYVLKTVICAIGVAIAAIALVFVAWPALVLAFSAISAAVAAGTAITGAMLWTLITAAAGVVTTAITLINSAAKTATNFASIFLNRDDPGWAARYGDYESFADYLRKNNFNNPSLNKLSGIAANIVDGISITAELIGFTELVRNGINVVKFLKDGGMEKIFNKVHFRSPSGKITFGTVKYGIKNMIRNVGEAKKLVTNTNVKRLTDYCEKYSKTKDIKKFLEGTNKVLNLADSMGDKGSKTLIKDKILDHIKDKTVKKTTSNEYISKVKSIVDKIKNTKKANRPAYQSTPAYAGIGGGSMGGR